MIDPLTAESWLHEREAECPAPGTETVEREDLSLRSSPLPYPWASAVRRARWSDAEAERGIDEVLAYFAARRRRFVWLVGPSSRPADLARRLDARGFGRDVPEDDRILVARLPVSGLPTNDAVRIVEVSDDRALRDSIAAMRTPWAEALFAERRRYLACPGRRSGFLVAYRGDDVVGAAGWTWTADGRAVLLNGGVVPEEQRRHGVYSEMTRWRLERARGRGCGYAVLIANPRTSGPILAKRGFADVGVMPILYSPR